MNLWRYVIKKQIVKEVFFIAKNTAETPLQRVRQGGTMGKLESRQGVIGSGKIDMCPQQCENTVF